MKWFLLLVASMMAGCVSGGDGGRPVALVIGNGAYGGDIPALRNPEHDAQTIAERLRINGFRTILLLDATRDEMLETLAFFGNFANRAPLAVVYYSGHGVEIRGQNLLLPVDFFVGTETDPANLQNRAVPLAQFGRLVAGHAGATLLVLDACRTDPTLPADDTTGARRLPSIDGMGKGLASEEMPQATVLYSTAPGLTAVDGDGEFSPFTASFLQLIGIGTYTGTYQPFLPLLRLSVLDRTQGRQTPTWLGSMPVLYGYSPSAANPVQRVINKSHPTNAPTQDGGLQTAPNQVSLNGVSVCTIKSESRALDRSMTMTTGVNSTLCGGAIGLPGTIGELIEPPGHGHVVFDNPAFGYAPDTDYVGPDHFVIKVRTVMNFPTLLGVSVKVRPLPRRG